MRVWFCGERRGLPVFPAAGRPGREKTWWDEALSKRVCTFCKVPLSETWKRAICWSCFERVFREAGL